MEECTITTNVISAIGSRILRLVLSLLRQECSLGVRQNSALKEGDTRQQFVQLLDITNDQMQATLIDPTLLRVTSSVTGQFQNIHTLCSSTLHQICAYDPTGTEGQLY